MIKLGLTAAERDAYETALCYPHRMRATITVRDRNEKVVASFSTSSISLSGSVQVDVDQDVTRTLDLAILKPGSQTSWVPNAPDDAAIFADNFVSATRGIYVSALGRWVDVPVFWGPVTAATDNGDQINIKASGKEVRALPPYVIWQTLHIGAGMQRSSAIRTIMDTIGETRYIFPEHPGKVGEPYSLTREASAWPAVNKIADGWDRQVFYNGEGYLVVRVKPSQTTVWTFRPGDGSVMLSKPTLDYDVSIARNTVEVLGRDPAGRRPRIRGVARAQANHVLSAASLARNGKDVVLLERIENDMTTNKAAKALAERRLDQLLTAAVNISFESMVIPHLEEGDIVAAEMNGNLVRFALKQFTIPLTVGDSMSIGSVKRISLRKQLVRR